MASKAVSPLQLTQSEKPTVATDVEESGYDHIETDTLIKPITEDAYKSFPKKCLDCLKSERCLWWIKRVSITIISLYLLGVVFINIWVNLPNRKVIQLFGDSLIGVPCEEYSMNYHIQNDLYYFDNIPEVTYYGQGGARIADLRSVLDSEVLHRFDYSTIFQFHYAKPADAIILYWDSDVNPGPRNGENPLDPDAISAYLSNLYYVLDQLTHNIDIVIMAGPTLSGELPRGQNPLDSALDYYVELNNATAAMYNITYINTRDIFFSALPADWDYESGYVTQDGEHPNPRGENLLRRTFRQALMNALW